MVMSMDIIFLSDGCLMIFRGLIYCQEPTISGGFPTMEQYSAQNILQTQPFGMNHFLVGGLEHEFYFSIYWE